MIVGRIGYQRFTIPDHLVGQVAEILPQLIPVESKYVGSGTVYEIVQRDHSIEYGCREASKEVVSEN